MKSFPTTNLSGLARLGASVGAALLRRGGDPGQAINGWLRQRAASGEGIVLNLGFKKVLLVTGPDLSAHVLEPQPRVDGFAAGELKKKGMAFLAPNALTISNGDEWARRRVYNETVLGTGGPHPDREAFLDEVNKGFATPVASTAEIRERMGLVMRGVVFGSGAPAGLPDDMDELMSVVQSPVKRTLFGWRYIGSKNRLYETLRRQWDEASDRSLVAHARRLGGSASDDNVQQLPHWMFTFTGSGTDLLTRTLAMVGSRPDVARKVADEIAATGSLDEPSAIDRLVYLEACLRETGRLFPPVTRTFHVAPVGDKFDGRAIPPGMEIVHYFPYQHRDTTVDPTANEFRPERWADEAAIPSSYLFLGGARSCPGEDLIVFVCKSALAQLIGRHGTSARAPALATDPLPVSFPRKEVRINA